MPESLLSKWLAHYDPIHRGWTPQGIANGVCATCGFFFPRLRGGYNLRRGSGEPAGAAGAEASLIRTFPWVRHEAAATYEYRLAAISGGGVENLMEAAEAEAAFGAAGEWLRVRPAPPINLRVRPAAGGRFEVCWAYPPGRQSPPVEFRIYSGGGAGRIDYAAPAAIIPYRAGRVEYQYTSGEFPDGAKVGWVVRAALACGEECNEAAVWAIADGQGPAATPVVIVEL